MYTLTNEVGGLAIIQQREIFAENGSYYKEKLLVKRQKATILWLVTLTEQLMSHGDVSATTQIWYMKRGIYCKRMQTFTNVL